MTKHDTAAPSLVWFRSDLRLADNPALHAAIERGAPILCAFVLEDDNGLRALGAASLWWLHHSLEALAKDLEKHGGRLDLFQGRSGTITPALADASNAGAVFWNRRYGGAAIKHDEAIKTAVASGDRHVESFNGRLIHEPWEIKTKTGGSYGVYTPYWKAAIALGDTSEPLPAPRKLKAAPYPAGGPKRVSLKQLGLLPVKPDWAAGWLDAWTPGEAGAHARLTDFLDGDLSRYEHERNLLSVKGTSHLSAHLRFGEISPRQIVHAAEAAAKKEPHTRDGTKKFVAEIGWREFDYHVMFYHPDVAEVNLHRQFDRMPWRDVPKAELDAWKKGQTGYPVVDAGMRELWATGYMHNRVRMITASFLIKHLMCDWRIGEKWFWDCLCDADPANNTMNWQWVAGSGADASPFFRIFNPVLQGQKFDPDGEYVKAHVPELAKLPKAAIHEPWKADRSVLAAAGVELGKTYPKPIVDHATGRARALAAYEKVKG
ncbi:deoxyribodipyrimidine photo-lyase [Beijerinckia sp. L45]|uniref:cryptochrome/photolyase family protein n=1 Tax=Beijerinckia sp. L45 TaxID=1641855 RepID=UPI00131DED3E|nr:deoxyribodipyrimidine photo-lyase [Beijerinckia sp. L45]